MRNNHEDNAIGLIDPAILTLRKRWMRPNQKIFSAKGRLALYAPLVRVFFAGEKAQIDPFIQLAGELAHETYQREKVCQTRQDRASSTQVIEPDTETCPPDTLKRTHRPHKRHEFTRPRPSKVSGLPLGIYPSANGKRFKAQILLDSRLNYLGTFDTPEDASEAYWRARAEADGPKDAA